MDFNFKKSFIRYTFSSGILLSCQLAALTPERPAGTLKTSENEKKHPHFFSTIDFLALQASVDGLGYAQHIDNFPTQLVANTQIHSQEKTLDFNWDFGFRLSFGYHTPLDKWDICLNYFYLRSEAKNHSSVKAGGGFMSEWSPSNNSNNWSAGGLLVTDLSGLMTNASGHWTLNLNTFDLLLSCPVSLTPKLTLQPKIGLSSAWLNQNFHVNLSGTAILATLAEFKDHLRNDNWGIGIKTGFDTQWEFANHFSSFLSSSISALYSFFDIHQSEKTKYPALPPFPQEAHPMHFHEKLHTIVPVFDLILGIRYTLPFHQGRYLFATQVGWEEHIFFQQNRWRGYLNLRQMDKPRNENLVLQGVSVQFKLDY